MKKFRKIKTVDNYKRPVLMFDDRRRLVDDTNYSPYKFLISEMISKGEVSLDELRKRASMLNEMSVSPLGDDAISVLNMKGVDGYDIDTTLQRIRYAVIKSHKQARAEFDKEVQSATEDYYKNKYAQKNNPAE